MKTQDFLWEILYPVVENMGTSIQRINTGYRTDSYPKSILWMFQVCSKFFFPGIQIGARPKIAQFEKNCPRSNNDNNDESYSIQHRHVKQGWHFDPLSFWVFVQKPKKPTTQTASTFGSIFMRYPKTIDRGRKPIFTPVKTSKI